MTLLLQSVNFLATTVFLLSSIASTASTKELSPTSPVFGILAQPLHGSNTSLYIAGSYVKWLEAGGARSIPIPDDLTDEDTLEELFRQIQGLLIPGGATDTMSFAIRSLLEKAWHSNQNEVYFPVWGTCMGFEYLVRYIGGDDILLGGYRSENQSLALEDVVRSSWLYSDRVVYDTVTSRNTTLNNHQYGLHPVTYWSNRALQSVWRITSVNHDASGVPFVSTLEPHRQSSTAVPFYAVQYHPEKNAFEYATYPNSTIPYEAIDHSEEGVSWSMAMARRAVQLARATSAEEHAYTEPDRFPYVYTYPQQVGVKFEQVFVIPRTQPEAVESVELQE